MGAVMDAPYAGLVDGRPVDHGQPHVLVSGRTGSGKSRTVLAPNIVMWGRRPVVCVSSKGDLAELTAPKRSTRGPCYLMDLSGEVRDDELGGAPVTRVASDPTALITDDDSALELAALLLEVGSLGGGDKGGGDSFWQALAMRPLAAILQAAAGYLDPDTGDPVPGGGVRWALAACENPGGAGDDDEETDVVDLTTASWDVAILRCASIDSHHGDSLLAAKMLDPKQRDSIGINARVALGAWALRAVAGRGELAPFRPEMLEAPGATLYIVSPLAGAAAPAASAALTSMVNHWRKRVGRLSPLLMVIDELPNTSPLPRLAAWIGEARGLGIRIVAAVQASSQFEPRWGSAGLKVLRDIFPAALILPGAPERELLEQAAWSVPAAERVTGSLGADGRASQSRDKVTAIEAAELLPREKGEGRLLLGGTPGHLVKLVDIAKTDLLQYP
ncbi:MAG: type IV secretory system conjugative DNA transfer family protein [Gordonia sp. (in: high G+C Gram-positive bacteria)]|uniref:type IV secretory system conjugative DNA transfer family protein n=1 Tax=Gordonia sp. (in: high G+C Gram-positive bacteria) TaxID=84139 RepID=UPI0039E69B1B